MTEIHLPDQVNTILKCFWQAGYEAYAVGGCIRDSLLGREPYDWDLTTSASPEEIKKLFPRTIDTGLQHGTVTVLLDHRPYEVTTYRSEGKPSLQGDLSKRDFTINAMAYNPNQGLIDLFDGQKDLQRKRIRCVKNARDRFAEDPLRTLRAVRFAAQLGFDLDEDTCQAIREYAPRLSGVSAERIRMELEKLVCSCHPSVLRIAYELGITQVVLPEFDRIMIQRQGNPHHIYTTGDHTLVTMEEIPPVPVLRFTMLFHDMGKPEVFYTDETGRDHFHGHAAHSEPIAMAIMKRLKFDNDTIYQVCNLVKNHSRYPELSGPALRKAASELGGRKTFEDFLRVKRADIMGHHPNVIPDKLVYLKELTELWREICAAGDCLSVKELAVNGADLIQTGISAGPQIGELLQLLLEEVLEHPGSNNKACLLKYLEQLR